MKLTRYGYDVIIGSLLIGLGLVIGGLFVELLPVRIPLLLAGILLTAFTLYFFRDPERTIPEADLEEEGIVLSPADGKVVVVSDIESDEFLQGPAKQISIFLSPLNVHVNRIPISGTVKHYRYVEGKYLVAFHEKSSELNERTHIGIENDRMKLLMKQIAGAVARRIVCRLTVGDTVTAGERFGMIKFGSRMDIIVPHQTMVEVKLGDMVVAGETILCRLPAD